MAEKTPSNAAANVHHRELLTGELTGALFTMDGRPVVNAGDVRRAEDGSIGVHISEFPEAAMLLRWQEGTFAADERALAKAWRADLSVQAPERLSKRLAADILPPSRKISNVERLKEFLDEFCDTADEAVLARMLGLLEVPDQVCRVAIARWVRQGRPPLPTFAPYTTHVFKVDLLFYLSIARGFVSGRRASNRADFAYLYYLPFTKAFVSGDRLHRRIAPLLLDDQQHFVAAEELKKALAEIDLHFEAMPESLKAEGVLGFPPYPPPQMDNAVTRLWDAAGGSQWRSTAVKAALSPPAPRHRIAEKATVAELEAKLAGAEIIPEAETPSDDALQYMVIQRRVPARKGKWRMVSADIEKASDEG